MFRAHVLIIRRSKLHYTASGIITPIDDRLVQGTVIYRCDDIKMHDTMTKKIIPFIKKYTSK